MRSRERGGSATSSLSSVVLRNRDLAELLTRQAKVHSEHRRRALERAARAALWRWTEVAADINAQGRSVIDLGLVGSWVATIMPRCLEDLPPVEERPRYTSFLTLADARKTLAAHPERSSACRGDPRPHPPRPW